MDAVSTPNLESIARRLTYIRASALNKPLKVIPEPSLKLVGELGRIGNNLNQYQRSANSNSTINFIEIDKLIGELKVVLMGGLK